MSTVHIDDARIAAFAEFMAGRDDIRPFDFCGADVGEPLPPREARSVVDLFFFVTAHQFGFWYEHAGRYDRPMIARLGGRDLKGSDYLFRCVTRAWERNPDFFSPAHMATVNDATWNGIFTDDAGTNPLPMWRENLDIIHRYTRWFRDHGTSPEAIVAAANGQTRSLASFLENAGRIPGYAEDRLRKKLLLLAVILENRPERFLAVTDPESYEPIIDYHLQRSALRTGLVVVDDPALREKVLRRAVVSPEEEGAIRKATFEAIRRLVRNSGKSVAAVDWFFFTNRRRCPEMTEPECPVCPVQAICRRETKLFQPVFRTTAY